MKQRNVMVNSSSFEEKIVLFEKKVKEIDNILDSMSKTMFDITGDNENWKSKVGLEVHRRYMENENKYDSIKEELDNYVNFLKETLKSYKDEEAKEDKSIDDQSSYLDVNE